MPIKRIWRGWTSPENAEAYQQLLYHTIFPGIAVKNIPGYRSIELLMRDLGDEMEFMTVMTFDSLDNVIAFQGENYEKAYVPDVAQRILKRWDKESWHYEVAHLFRY